MNTLTAQLSIPRTQHFHNADWLAALEQLDQAGLLILDLTAGRTLELTVQVTVFDEVPDEEAAESIFDERLAALDDYKLTVLLGRSDIEDPDDVLDDRTSGLNYGLSCAEVA